MVTLMDNVAVIPSFTRLADNTMSVGTKSLRLKPLFQFVGSGAGLFDTLAAAVTAVSDFRLQSANSLPLRRSGFVGRKSGRRYKQRQGDNEMFHVLTCDGRATDYAHHCQGCQYA